ncbi:MAG: phosphosulfolactate synthase [Bacteroidetes bacterium]|nr:phosphosulfolactate synthase [Bacteroidota bacterium]
MNSELFQLKNLPARTGKPREEGITMVMDKGLSLREVEDFISVSGEYTDLVKLGFGTGFLTPHLIQKIKIYQSAGIPVYFGGTLFEAYIARNQFEDYLRLLEKTGITHAEVSDGSIEMHHDEKCEYIRKLSNNVIVLSEVGSKDAEKIIPPYEWIEQMESEISAGVWKVIAEARESGTVGIFRGTGEVRSGLVAEIIRKIPLEKILWEAPQKTQQVWFIKLYGTNVNMGNIAPNEVIPLETLRLGLRGDSFHFFLNS